MQSTFLEPKSADSHGHHHGWKRTLGGPARFCTSPLRPSTAGAKAVRRVIEAAPRLGVTTLTLYAFASDNWDRPAEEVASLLRLFQTYLIRELASCLQHGVRVNVIGRRDRLPPGTGTCR